MRLTQEEIRCLIEVVSAYMNQHKGQLYLFGSRVHDHLRGGDIDLLLLVADESVKNAVKKKKLDILVGFKTLLGDQKIDFKIAAASDISQDPFLQTIMGSAVPLYQWA